MATEWAVFGLSLLKRAWNTAKVTSSPGLCHPHWTRDRESLLRVLVGMVGTTTDDPVSEFSGSPFFGSSINEQPQGWNCCFICKVVLWKLFISHVDVAVYLPLEVVLDGRRLDHASAGVSIPLLPGYSRVVF